MEALEQRIDELENRVTALERRVQEQLDKLADKYLAAYKEIEMMDDNKYYFHDEECEKLLKELKRVTSITYPISIFFRILPYAIIAYLLLDKYLKI